VRRFPYVILGFLLSLAMFTTIDFVVGQDRAPQLSADSRVTILRAQLKQKQIESQYLQLQQQLNGLRAQYDEASKGMQDVVDAAYKDAKLDKQHWILDLDKLEFTKIPVPGSKAEEKKP